MPKNSFPVQSNTEFSKNKLFRLRYPKFISIILQKLLKCSKQLIIMIEETVFLILSILKKNKKCSSLKDLLKPQNYLLRSRRRKASPILLPQFQSYFLLCFPFSWSSNYNDLDYLILYKYQQRLINIMPKKEEKAKVQSPAKDDKKGKDKKTKEEPKKEDPKDKGKKGLDKNKTPEKNEKKKADEKGKKDKGTEKKQQKQKEVKKGKSPKKNDDKGKSPINKSVEKIAPPKIKSQEDIIKDSGLLESYELFLRSLCKHGLPSGDIYEYAAQQIQKYEKKKRARELKMRAEMQIKKASKRNERLKSQQS